MNHGSPEDVESGDAEPFKEHLSYELMKLDGCPRAQGLAASAAVRENIQQIDATTRDELSRKNIAGNTFDEYSWSQDRTRSFTEKRGDSDRVIGMKALRVPGQCSHGVKGPFVKVATEFGGNLGMDVWSRVRKPFISLTGGNLSESPRPCLNEALVGPCNRMLPSNQSLVLTLRANNYLTPDFTVGRPAYHL